MTESLHLVVITGMSGAGKPWRFKALKIWGIFAWITCLQV